ncbi:putative ran guanine nucleotide release factor [Tetrabaena socialis]|uniref:Putative ran guanine nucleotide release factor n=1 Tax=Tetrabaena socialis TaxID=47790 RepID=A0A2J8A7C2_9CHLO|nr:putative ran guanine nucleotide release factor [Tetrabaena socialis]|eukprot:PNH08418.1 putative ran guanine nucleotide release factor [Tetrabaena socialis]
MAVTDTAAPAAPTERQLWDGAIVCELPGRLADMSDVRPVPDHQEVWADPELDQALIFEIVEHDASVLDADAGRHMFEDAAAGNEALASSIGAITTLEAAREVPGIPEVSYTCLVRGRQTVRRGQEANDTIMLLAVLRLPRLASDLLITLSTPAAAQQAGEESEEVVRLVLRTLRVLEYGLFG